MDHRVFSFQSLFELLRSVVPVQIAEDCLAKNSNKRNKRSAAASSQIFKLTLMNTICVHTEHGLQLVTHSQLT